MNPTHAQDILNELVKMGKISQDDVLEAVKRSPSNETKRLVDLIHGTFCQAVHPEECAYYTEENDVDPWGTLGHREWLDKTVDMMNELEIKTENEFLSAYQAAMRVKKEIRLLTLQAADLLQMMLRNP